MGIHAAGNVQLLFMGQTHRTQERLLAALYITRDTEMRFWEESAGSAPFGLSSQDEAEHRAASVLVPDMKGRLIIC